MSETDREAASHEFKKLTVLSAGAAKEVVKYLAEAFSRETGCLVDLHFAPVGAIRESLMTGEAPDLVVLAAPVLTEFIQLGKVLPATVKEIGKVGVGIAVRTGEPLSDISTPEALRKTLLKAETLVYADPAGGASSGIHFANVLERLGIANELQTKSRLLSGGYEIMEAIAAGRGQIGVQQITEILPVKGVTLVGPLPAELQKVTVYAAGVLTSSKLQPVAAEMLQLLARPEMTDLLHVVGFGRY